VNRFLALRGQRNFPDSGEQVLPGIDRVQNELPIVLGAAHLCQCPISVVDDYQSGTGIDDRSGGGPMIDREIEHIANVVVETNTDDPPVCEGTSRLVLSAEFLFSGDLFRQADKVRYLA
jgi:hypothetical protein